MSDQKKVYTDENGRSWVEDPNGTHVDWRRDRDGGWADGVFWPIPAMLPGDKNKSVIDDGDVSCHPVFFSRVEESAPDQPSEPATAFDEAWAASGRQYGEEELENVRLGWEMALEHFRQGAESVDHREALARVVQMTTGAEPDPKVLDAIMATGVRFYFVEVPCGK